MTGRKTKRSKNNDGNNYPDIDYVRIAVSHDMGGNILLSMGETSGVLPQGH
jgi:hypothetical protein